MNKIKVTIIAAALAMTMSFIGCSTTGTSSSVGTVALCAKCGQIAGTDVCCKEGQPKCAKCGLVMGSPGCCKLPKDATGLVQLCTMCGEIKGTDACCKPAAQCAKCGLHKGSPACCKIAAIGK